MESARLVQLDCVTKRLRTPVLQTLLNLSAKSGCKMANSKIPWHIILDIVCLVLLGIADMLFYIIPIRPSHRGFYCDDQSLQKPFQKETIPTSTTLLVGFFVTIPVVSILKPKHWITHCLRSRVSLLDLRNNSAILTRHLPKFRKLELTQTLITKKMKRYKLHSVMFEDRV